MKHFILFIFITLANQAFAKNNIDQLINADELQCAKDAFALLKKKKTDEALVISNFCKDPAIQKMIIWTAINDDYSINYKAGLDFLDDSQHYPNYEKLFRVVEKNFTENIQNKDILNFYTNYFPQTELGYELLVRSTKDSTEDQFGEALSNSIARKYFLSNHFKISQRDEFLKLNRNAISQATIHEKISSLIWRKKTRDAKKILNLADEDHQKLFKARLLFAGNSSRAPRYLKSVPKKLSKDPSLYYDIVRWLEKRDKDKKITKYITSLKTNENAKKWVKIRIRNSRYLLKEKEYNKAYQVVADHNITDPGYELSESEWFAGWIALRFLNKPKLAVKHFSKMYNSVTYAISLSRGAYWLGRAYSQSGEEELANQWYQTASSYSTTYYGQMAILELQEEMMIDLPRYELVQIEELTDFVKTEELLRIALYFSHMGEVKKAQKFFGHLILSDPSPEKIKLIVSLSTYSGDYEIINKTARLATRFNVVTLANYPIIKNLPIANEAKENALVMSIIKQESGFNTSAVSSVGAVGFMQLMPATAREMSRRLRIPYSKRKLQKDPKYNIKLGSGYINMLLKRFDQSYILSIAAYNSGPRSTKRWLKENGDVRNFKDPHNVIDWVEKITYSETRNYVQRILENTIIYLHLLTQKGQQFATPVAKPE